MYTANRQDQSGRDLHSFAQGTDLLTLQARAGALRAQAVADMTGDAFAAIGRGLRAVWASLERGRADRALRQELSQLDAHTLKDLGLSPYEVPAVTHASLADHPLRRPASDRPANENGSDTDRAATTDVRTAA